MLKPLQQVIPVMKFGVIKRLCDIRELKYKEKIIPVYCLKGSSVNIRCIITVLAAHMVLKKSKIQFSQLCSSNQVFSSLYTQQYNTLIYEFSPAHTNSHIHTHTHTNSDKYCTLCHPINHHTFAICFSVEPLITFLTSQYQSREKIFSISSPSTQSRSLPTK